MPALLVQIDNLPEDVVAFVYYKILEQPGVLGVVPFAIDEQVLSEQIRAFVPPPLVINDTPNIIDEPNS